MIASSSRASLRRLGLSGVTSALPPPAQARCPACIVQARLRLRLNGQDRGYVSGPKVPRGKVKKVFSEFSSPDIPTSSTRRNSAAPQASRGTEPQDTKATDSALRKQLDDLVEPRASSSSSSSSSSTQLDPRKTIEVVYPLIFRRKLRDLLDPHLTAISSVISQYAESLPSSLENEGNMEERRRIATILGHCYFRSAFTASHAQANNENDALAERYATYLIRESFRIDDHQQITLLHQNVQNGLERMGQSKSSGSQTYRIPIPIAAAWAILSSNSGPAHSTPTLPIGTVPSSDPEGMNRFLERCLIPLGQSVSEHEEAIQRFCIAASSSSTSSTVPMPTTKEALQAAIASLRSRSDHAGLISLWEEVRTAVSQSTSAVQSIVGDEELAAFLRAFKRPSPSLSKSSSSVQLDEFAQQVLALCAKPLPRTIASTLLALRARPDDSSIQVGDEVRSLDTPLSTQSQSRTKSTDTLENLHAAWRASGEKDVKMYMMYMEGLGLFGDLPGLQRTWNELVRDQRCRELYLAEDAHAASSTFPPTHALNHMISAALLIPTTGPPVALDLFEQALRKDSSIPIDLVTINTVLRHHARQADLAAMTMLFEMAEQSGFKPDVVTYTTLLQGLLRAGQLEMAKRALSTMHAQGISPNERTCSMLIADLAKSGEQKALQHAEELLRLMRQMGMRTNEVTWTGLIAGYFRGGWDEDGWDAVARMERHGHKLNRVGYNVLLRQSEKGQGTGIRLWKRMIQQGITPNSDSYLLALSPLVRQGRWEEADQVIKYMKTQGFRPEKVALARVVDSVQRRRV